MKRLNLEAFKAKKINPNTAQAADKLLGQVLGDCHDEHRPSGGSSSGSGDRANANRMDDTNY